MHVVNYATVIAYEQVLGHRSQSADARIIVRLVFFHPTYQSLYAHLNLIDLAV